jgi:phosphatidylglycerophosphate synthase
VKNALIFAAPAGAQILFGHPLLERILIQSERAGLERFFVVCSQDQRGSLATALGRFSNDPRLRIVDSVALLLLEPLNLDASTPFLLISGDVVVARTQLDRLLQYSAVHPTDTARLEVEGGGDQSVLMVGPLRNLIKRAGSSKQLQLGLNGTLPLALKSDPDAVERAEIAMARVLRFETTETDGLMAQTVDRKMSWRASYRLARTRVTPSQITIANTVLGLLAAWMFSARGYWLPLIASLLFLISVTIDGIDGEVARLKMAESPFGKRLDVLTDNLVNIAVLVAIGFGCYRNSGSRAYLYLLPLLLGGFGLCAISVGRALRVSGKQAERWIGQVERICGRDFAYLLVPLAAIHRLNYVAWGTAFGTYIFAIVLWWMTTNQTRLLVGVPRPERHVAAEGL